MCVCLFVFCPSSFSYSTPRNLCVLLVWLPYFSEKGHRDHCHHHSPSLNSSIPYSKPFPLLPTISIEFTLVAASQEFPRNTARVAQAIIAIPMACQWQCRTDSNSQLFSSLLTDFSEPAEIFYWVVVVAEPRDPLCSTLLSFPGNFIKMDSGNNNNPGRSYF